MGPVALLVALCALEPEPGPEPSRVPAAAASGASEGELARLRLRWSAPPSCPPAEDARALVRALTGARIVEDGPHDAQAEVTIEPQGAGFIGRVRARGPEGEHARELSADDCGVLARALAVVVAVELDAVAVASRAEIDKEDSRASPASPVQPSRGVPEPSPRDRGEGDAPPRAEPSPRDRSRSLERSEHADAESPPASSSRATRKGLPRGLEIGGRVALGVGGLVLPGVGLGVQAGPYIGTRWLHVHAVAEYWAARTITWDDDPSAGAVLRLATGGVRACGVIERGRVRVPLCAGVDGGAVLAEGRGAGLSSRQDARAPWAAVILQPGVSFRVTPWLSVFAAFEGAVSLYRARFRLDGMPPAADLVTVGAFGPRGFFGLELHAPRAERSRRPRPAR